MSMLGSQALTEIVNRNPDLPVGEILFELNEQIQKVLQQKHNDSNDGMDITIISFDKSSQKIQFAGAKNPLFFVQDNEMKVVKGSRFAIGGTQYNDTTREYPTHEIEYNGAATLYLFSDGFQDQFGGPKGKKFKVKNFRELLLENHQQSMQKQQELLDQTITDWIDAAKETQTDDMCVVGVRVES